MSGGGARAGGLRFAPTALRCSQDGRAAQLVSLTAFATLGQWAASQRVEARLRAPPVLLRASPPTRRPHPTPHPLPGGSGSSGAQGERIGVMPVSESGAAGRQGRVRRLAPRLVRPRPPCSSPFSSPSPALVQCRSPATTMAPATMTFASPVVPEPPCHPSRRGGRGGSGGGAWWEARSAAGRAARSVAERFHPLTRRALSERSERSERSECRERSESCGAPVLRAPQRSRRAARGDLPPERPRPTPRALPGGDTRPRRQRP